MNFKSFFKKRQDIIMKDGFIKVKCYSPSIRVADVNFNKTAIIEAIRLAGAEGVKVLTLPELCLTSASLKGLYYQEKLLTECEAALIEIAEASRGIDTLTLVGAPLAIGSSLYSCAVAIKDGKILGVVPKNHVEFYKNTAQGGIFSEPSEEDSSVTIGGKKYPFGKLLFKATNVKGLTVGAIVGEDLGFPTGTAHELCSGGATIISTLGASFELIGREERRRTLISSISEILTCGYMLANPGESESTTETVSGAHSIICECGDIIEENAPFSSKTGECVSIIDVGLIMDKRLKLGLYKGAKTEYKTIEIEFNVEKTDISIRKFNKTPFFPRRQEETDRRCEKILTMQSRALAHRLTASYSKTAVIGISGGLDSTLALLASVKSADYLGWDRKRIVAVTMPCFGTTKRTRSNATELCNALGVTLKEINIFNAIRVHFEDIGHSESDTNVTYENAQARERTQILMDIANETGGIVIGTGDLSEVALGWSTYNGDHMSMYNVNCSIPKTLMQSIVAYYAKNAEECVKNTLNDILSTPISPELLPKKEGEMVQQTEDIVGPYILHDFFLYNFIGKGFSPEKIFRIAVSSFKEYDSETIKKWLSLFVRRFFTQQFKRACSPDGVKIGTVSFNASWDFTMPSDASSELFKLN